MSFHKYKKNIFSDSDKFRRIEDGSIVYKTDCSTWAKIFKNGLLLDEHLQSIYTKPKIIFSIGFGKSRRNFKKHEGIFDGFHCELCNYVDLSDHTQNVILYYGKIICRSCLDRNTYLSIHYCHGPYNEDMSRCFGTCCN
jgi:hypothetical protein